MAIVWPLCGHCEAIEGHLSIHMASATRAQKNHCHESSHEKNLSEPEAAVQPKYSLVKLENACSDLTPLAPDLNIESDRARCNIA